MLNKNEKSWSPPTTPQKKNLGLKQNESTLTGEIHGKEKGENSSCQKLRGPTFHNVPLKEGGRPTARGETWVKKNIEGKNKPGSQENASRTDQTKNTNERHR